MSSIQYLRIFYHFRPDVSVANSVHRPHPIQHIRKIDFTHTLKGFIAGLLIVIVAITNLVLFFSLDSKDAHEDAAEYLSKASNTAINLVGIIGKYAITTTGHNGLSF